MDIPNLFESKAQQLFWRPIDAGRLTGVPAPQSLLPGQAYFTIRLCEMYLAAARKLWRQIYPLVHCYTQFSGINDHAILSPAEFTSLGDMNLDRLVNVNLRLSGPNPYNGGDIALIAGLYAVPAHDSAVALISAVSSFAALDPGPMGRTVMLSNLIQGAVESILGLDQVALHFGVRDTFHTPSNPLTSGYFAGIAAPASTVDASQLWVVNGRLQKGHDAASCLAYTDHDYMLISIERTDARDDWAQLSELQDCQNQFAAIMGDRQFTCSERQDRLAAQWPIFIQALAASKSLIDPDRRRIASLVAADLLSRLKQQDEANPFLRPNGTHLAPAPGTAPNR